MANSCNVIWLDDYKKQPRMSQSTMPARSALHASVDDDGNIDFGIDSLAPGCPADRAALLMVALTMCLRLSRDLAVEACHG